MPVGRHGAEEGGASTGEARVEETGVLAGVGEARGVGGSGAHRQGGTGREIWWHKVGRAGARGVGRLGAWGWGGGSRTQGSIEVHQGLVDRLDLGSR
jgi:hypothetical protein